MIRNLIRKYKQCSTCKQKLPIADYYRNRSSPDGRRSNCIACSRVSKGRWYYEHKGQTQSARRDRREKVKQFVRSKKLVPCTDCDLMYHHTMMEFDHVRGIKSRTISEMVIASTSLANIQAEIDKCDLVCVLCHRARTWNRQNPDDQVSSRPTNV